MHDRDASTSGKSTTCAAGFGRRGQSGSCDYRYRPDCDTTLGPPMRAAAALYLQRTGVRDRVFATGPGLVLPSWRTGSRTMWSAPSRTSPARRYRRPDQPAVGPGRMAQPPCDRRLSRRSASGSEGGRRRQRSDARLRHGWAGNYPGVKSGADRHSRGDRHRRGRISPITRPGRCRAAAYDGYLHQCGSGGDPGRTRWCRATHHLRGRGDKAFEAAEPAGVC